MRRGHDPAAEALRELFQELLVDEQPLRRIGALMAGSDIRYPLPGHDHHALIGTFAPDLALHTDRGTTSVAELMHTARPVFLDLADRADLRETARDWRASRRHPHRRNRSPTGRRPPDPPGRPHRLGRNHRRTHRHRRARAARRALRLVRHTHEIDSAQRRTDGTGYRDRFGDCASRWADSAAAGAARRGPSCEMSVSVLPRQSPVRSYHPPRAEA